MTITSFRNLAATAFFGLVAASQAQLSINLNSSLDPNSPSYKAFQTAAGLWTSLLTTTTPTTVNLSVGYSSLGGNILGQTSSTENAYSYSSVRTALASRASSALDATAVASLETGSTYGFYINDTTTNSSPHAATSNQVRMTSANAKALGLYTGTATSDASITFNSDFGSEFDFDRSNGIASNQIDFVGIATHEIGHALGFDSGVDILDYNAFRFSDATFNPYHYTLDLFRYTPFANGGSTRSFLASNYAAYFAFGGNNVTSGPAFSTGQTYGDGNQASHWKANEITGTYLGIMDPTAGDGEFLAITQNDLNAFDAIGYNLRTQATPEPSALAALGLGALALLRRRKRA